MAISRVTGRMLQDNLVRDNNLAVNTDTLYIDVANNKVGINTAATAQTLTINGNVGVGNLEIAGNTVSSNGNLVLVPTGNVKVSNVNINDLAEPVANSDAATKFYVDSLAGNISFSISDGVTSQTIDNGDTITFDGVANQTVATVSATDIVQIGLANDVVISNSLSVNGNLTIGNLSVNSLGSGQVVYVSASNNFATSSNLAFDGSNLSVVGSANIDNLTVDGTSISSQANLSLTTSTNGNLEFTIDSAGVSRFISTTALTVPTGNTLERPGTPDTGAIRFNTLSLSLEVYNGSNWIDVGEGLASVTTQTIVGDGSTITFALNQSATAASIIVSTNGVVQAPGTAYVVTTNQITFAEAPLTTDVVEIRFIANLAVIDELTNSSGNAKVRTSETAALVNVTGNLAINGSFLQVPQYANSTVRDSAVAAPAAGMIVLTGNIFQGYNGTGWVDFNT